MTSSYLEYAARGKTAWWRYVACIALALGLTMLLGLVLAAALGVTHALPDDFETRVTDPGHPISFFLGNGVLFGLLLAGLAAAARIVHGKRFIDLLGAWTWSAFARGAGVWLLVLVAAALVDFAIAPGGFKVSADGRTLGLVAVALPALAVQTFTEEVIFRGYVTQGLLLATRRMAPTVLISGLLFGALHIPNGTPQALSATAFGFVMAFIAIRTGSIAFTSGLHLVNNAFGAIVVVSGGDVFRNTPGLFTQNTPHLMWFDTVLGVVAFIGLAVFIDRAARRTTA